MNNDNSDISSPLPANNNEYLLVNAAGIYKNTNPIVSKGLEDNLFLFLCDGKLDLNGNIMTAGQAALIKPKTPIAITPIKGLKLCWTRFTGYGTDIMLSACNLRNSSPVNTNSNDFANIEKEFNLLCKESKNFSYCFKISAAARLTTIVIALCGNQVEPNEKATVESDSLSNSNDKINSRLMDSLDYIHNNYAEDISLEMLSHLSDLSISRFRTVFREEIGTSPLDYLISFRIKKAKELISAGGMTLREVSESVGYQDQLYFSRLFKKRTGIIPSEYIKSIQQKNQKLD